MDPCPLVHAHQDSSSNSDRPHAAEIHAYRMPYCCLLGVSSHSPGCGVMFPTIQKNISQLVPSDHYTNPHNSCLCWWKSLKKECITDPCVTTSYVLEISPQRAQNLIPCPCAHRALEDWPFWPVILTTASKKLLGKTVEQLVTVKSYKLVETCAVHQQQVVMFPRELHSTLFPPPITTASTTHVQTSVPGSVKDCKRRK